MDLNQEIKKATDTYIIESLPKVVEEKVNKMVDGILQDVFSNYSTTAKSIKAKIEEKLDVNLQQFDTVDYNHLVSKAINDSLLELVNIQPIMDLCKDAIGFVKKKEIKLSEIVEMVISASQEENDQEGEGEITVFVEENAEHDWVKVWLDIEPDTKKDNCTISFIVSTKRQNIFCFKTSSFMSKLGAVTPSKISQMNKLEHQIFRLYSAGVKVEIDQYDFYNSWDRY